MCWFQICRRGDAWGKLGPEVKWLNPQWGHLLLHLVIYPLPLFAGMRRNSLEVTSKLQTWTWLYFIAKNIWKHVVWPSFNSMNLRYIEMMTRSCLSYLFVNDVPLAMFFHLTRNQNVGNVWCQRLWWQNMCSGKIPGSVPEKWSEHVAWMRNSHNLQPFYETVKVAKTDIEGNLSVLVEGLWGLVSIKSCSTCLIYMHNSTLHINTHYCNHHPPYALYGYMHNFTSMQLVWQPFTHILVFRILHEIQM